MKTMSLVVAALIIASVLQSAQAQLPEEIDEKAASEAAPQVPSDDPLTAEMLEQMLTYETQTNPMLLGLAPVFRFESFAEEHGLAKSRKAIVPLLSDSSEEVREQAAKAALEWFSADDLGDDLIASMLKDESWYVKKVALHFVPDSGLDPEVLFALAKRPRASLHIEAMNELPRLILAGNETAKAILMKRIGSWNSRSAANAIILAGSLGTNGRFAEDNLRRALSDRRTHSRSLSLCMHYQVENRAAAAEALCSIGFREDATAEALRDVCQTEAQRYLALGEDEYMDDQLWVNVALALAKCRQEYEPVREAVFLRTAQTENSLAPDAETIESLLEHAPEAIIGWEHGLMVCRRLIDTPQKRRVGFNWRALRKYPAAAKVFEVEIQQYFEEETSEELNAAVDAYDCAISEVIAIRAADGFSNEDLEFAFRLVGLQRRSPDDYTAETTTSEFVDLLREHHKEYVAEMIMLDLLNSTSVNPDYFRRILSRLTPEAAKSKSRLRLEKLLEDLREEESK